MFSILVSVVLVVFTISGILFEFIKWRANRLLKDCYALKEWPIIGFGSTMMIINETKKLSKKIQSDVRKPRFPIRFWLGHKLCLIVTDPDDLKIILNSSECLDKSDEYQLVHFNLGLGNINKEAWKRDRRTFNPTFRPSVMNQFIPILNANAVHLCAELKRLNAAEAATEFHELLTKTVFQQTTRTIYASDYRFSVAKAKEMRDSLEQLEKTAKKRLYNLWYRSDFIFRRTSLYNVEMEALNCTNKLITEIIKCEIVHDVNETKTCDGDDASTEKQSFTIVQKVLHLYHNKSVSEEFLYDNLRLLFAASSMTTIISMHYILLMLAIHTEYQDRVVEELHSIFLSADEPVTIDKLQKMPLIDMVIKEVTRLYPALPIISRQCGQNLDIKHGTVPKGAKIILLLQVINRDKKYWGKNANDFYPERFHVDNMKNVNVNPYSYMSFSKGPRNCIGEKYGMMALKILLAHLLRNFKFTTNMKMREVPFKWYITAYKTTDRPFELEPRSFWAGLIFTWLHIFCLFNY